jgi:O-antigen/teichoic acid export membrane protein
MSTQQEQEIKDRSSSGRVLYVLKDTVLYGILLAISKVSLLIVLPILTHFLSNSHYGILDTLMMTGIVFVSFAAFGQDDTIGRYYYDNNDLARKQIVTSSLFLVALASTILVAVCYLFADPILMVILGGTEFKDEFYALLGYVPLISSLQVMRSISRWSFRKRTFFVLNIGQTSMVLLFTCIFVGAMGLGIKGAFYAQIVSSGVFMLVGIILLRDLFTFSLSSKLFVSLFKYGAPLSIALVLNNYMNVLDKSIYNHLFGAETLGTYTFAARYATFASIPIFALSYAWSPVIYSVYKEATGEETFRKTINTVVGIFALLLFLQMAFAEVAIILLTPDTLYESYAASKSFMLPLTTAIYIGAIGLILGTGIELSRKTHYNILIIVTSLLALFAVANIARYTGAKITIAYGVLAYMCVYCILRHIVSYKLYTFRYETFKIYAMLVLSSSLCFIFANVQPNNITVQVALRMSLFVLLLIVVWRTMIDKADRTKLVRKILRKDLPQ